MNKTFEARFINVGLISSVIAVLIFFYIPIFTLILFSFKEGRYLNLPFDGWTLDWYRDLFTNSDVGKATLNSLIIAVSAMLISTAVGLGAAQSFVRFDFRGKKAFQLVALAPLVFPQLLLGVVLLLWFSVLGNIFDFSNNLLTAIIGHCVYLVPFTTIIISVQAATFDPTLEQAAQDFGATPWEVFREVTFPILWPGIFSAAIFAFLLSWGNFYITYSLSGTGRSLPTFVFSGMALGSTPLYPALATVTFVAGLLLIVVAESLRRRSLALTQGAPKE
ncbi:ABC transporter permease [Sulfitobacter sp.]|uniref:ABC transporter permease n=1 Tax=Sulfitobacter sp. TaxID=1903071 RepID=UPI003001BC9A